MGLDEQLRSAKERLRRAIAALAPKHKGGEMEEYRDASANVLALERQAAAAVNDEYAETIKFPVAWDTGAPMPHVVANDQLLILLFYVRSIDPLWDGTYVTVRDIETSPDPVALVQFKGYTSFRFGDPNDEVLNGHRLWGRGLEPYSTQVVRNSRWLAEIEATNSVHRGYNPQSWRNITHYIFWFHDSTFECLAGPYTVEVLNAPFPAALKSAAERLNP
jgi:hypothetical protein